MKVALSTTESIGVHDTELTVTFGFSVFCTETVRFYCGRVVDADAFAAEVDFAVNLGSTRMALPEKCCGGTWSAFTWHRRTLTLLGQRLHGI